MNAVRSSQFPGQTLRVATYNIHKGVRGVGPRKRLEIHNLGLGIEALDADLVFLQEVRHFHHREARRFQRTSFGWPDSPQADFLAPEGYVVAYRTNAVTRSGEHGNALLSRWPMGEVGHHDVSDHRFEQRGLLHVPVIWGGIEIHAIVAHLGLMHSGRVRQVERIAAFIDAEVPAGERIVVAGDFNDWGEKLDAPMREIGLVRAELPGAMMPRTFPSRVPVFSLDRIYMRGFACRSTLVPRGSAWARMSDHLPFVAELGPDSIPAGTDAVAGDAVVLSGGNEVSLLRGGDMLFPAMCEAIYAARHEVWLASYIFHDDGAAQTVIDALVTAAQRGLLVSVVVDGFGADATWPGVQARLFDAGVHVALFRPLNRWWSWLQPGQLRRLHHKLCVVDAATAFVGGINIIDDRFDLHHGWSELPRLDFAVRVRGPLAPAVHRTAQALWMRASLGQAWREELLDLANSAQPLARARRLIARLRSSPRAPAPAAAADPRPVRAAFLVRDNLRFRRAIERSYVEAIRGARRQVDIVSAYFYPDRSIRHALRDAARRGVRVRLLLQGRWDYRMAELAAYALCDELLGCGVEIHEYRSAFLHAKVAVVDDDWATVGSSNIDPLSLLLNLEANVVVRDRDFAGELRREIDRAVAVSVPVTVESVGSGPQRVLRRGFIAWCARLYLRVAGVAGRY